MDGVNLEWARNSYVRLLESISQPYMLIPQLSFHIA